MTRRGSEAKSKAEGTWAANWPIYAAVALILISIVVRIVTRNVISMDLQAHILPWYAKLQKFGILTGLGKDFYNYTPPYLYLVALATLTSSFIPAVVAIKLISTAFDIVMAVMIYKIVRLQRPLGHLPELAAAVFFAAPTVVANTGIWGQADSILGTFALSALYFLLIDRPLPSIVCIGIALSFKPQAIFLAPLFLLAVLWRKMPWYFALLVPVVYALMMLPAVAAGRTWTEVLMAYPGQAGAGKGLTHNGATLYVFLPKSEFSLYIWLGTVLAILCVLAWVAITALKSRRRDLRTLLLLALISVTLTPFLLPNMHERYFYLGDAISIALAFTLPALWFVPILFQLSSGLAYSMYLLSAPSACLVAAAVINILILVLLFIAQASGAGKTPAADVQAPPSPDESA